MSSQEVVDKIEGSDFDSDSSQSLKDALKLIEISTAEDRNITYNPQGDEDDPFVGCNTSCRIIGESDYNTFCARREFRKGRSLYFCLEPKAPRFSDGTPMLCLIRSNLQAKDLKPGVKSGNVRLRNWSDYLVGDLAFESKR